MKAPLSICFTKNLLCDQSVSNNFVKPRSVETDINSPNEIFKDFNIYRIQDEVHRFSVSKTIKAKSSTLKRSSLEKISGIGKAKAAILLRELGGLAAVKRASVEELSAIKGISKSDATNIFEYFHAEK